jgi:transposase
MIPVPSDVRVWLAVGRTDMRKGMNGLALQVQEALGRDPHAGDLYVFRGARGDLIKIIWHDGIGMSLYSKRLEQGRFLWPSPADGRWPSRRRSSPTCSTASTGGTRGIHSARSAPGSAFAICASQRPGFMIRSRYGGCQRLAQRY